jgi:uncharacterized protein (DUF924 family)
MTEEISAILDFWFGSLDEAGFANPDMHGLWFKKSEATDATLRERFGEQVERAIAGELDAWAESDRGLIALVLLLDQFTRNIYRDSPRAFAGDQRALALAQQCIARGHHQRLPAIHQAFLLMPLEHAEDPDLQQECVELFEELTAVTGSEEMQRSLQYAEAHRDVIRQFGRFPHRNAVLGRESTHEEMEYLKTHGGF